MSDSFSVQAKVSVDYVVKSLPDLSIESIQRIADAANDVLVSRGVNVSGADGVSAASASVGRDPGFNVADHEGARRRGELKEQLVATSGVGVNAYNVLFGGPVKLHGINFDRRVNGRVLVPTITPQDFAKYAQVALTDEVLNSIEAAQLPLSANRPLLFVPDVPVLTDDAKLTHEEVVALWEIAGKYNNVELASFEGRLEFLRQWSADELVNARGGEPGLILGVVIPTEYDRARVGTYQAQHEQLLADQVVDPSVIDARLFHGSLLACTDVNRPIDSDVSYVRAVRLDPKPLAPDKRSGGLFVPCGYVDGDNASVVVSDAGPRFDSEGAGRRAVRIEPLALGR